MKINITQKEARTLLDALDLLIDAQNDTVCHTRLTRKLLEAEK